VVLKETRLVPIDNSKIWSSLVFHKYVPSQLTFIKLNFFAKVCVKSSKYYNFLKKKKFKCFIWWTVFRLKYIDNTTISNSFSSNIILKKRLTPRGKIILGPSMYILKRKKFINSFINVL